jgi:peptidoglycan/xylan/chitin deacetylase (PgdA/CDA1 family)
MPKRKMRKKTTGNFLPLLLINLLAILVLGIIVSFYLLFFAPRKIKILSASIGSNKTTFPAQKEIVFVFNQWVDKNTVEKSFKISPSVLGTITWKNGKTLALQLDEHLKNETNYEIRFEMNGIPLPFFPTTAPEIYNLQFKTGKAPEIVFTNPASYEQNVPLNKFITFEFNQKIAVNDFKSYFFIKPKVDGGFEVKNRQIIFKPHDKLENNTEYMVGLLKGMPGVDKQQLTQDYFFRFKTIDHGESTGFKNVRAASIPILMYHNVGEWDIYESALSQRFKIPPLTLDTHLQYISENYNVISLSNIYDSLTNDIELPENPIVLTFDDGWRGVYTEAFPLLQKYDLRATIFLITSHYGEKDGYLTKDQIQEMIDSGFVEIGNHTVHHPMLGFLNQNDIMKEIKDANASLKQDFGIHSTTFSYPGGSYNKLVLEVLEKLGYKTAVTVNAGQEQSEDELLLLKRIAVDGGDTVEILEEKLTNIK